MTVETSLAVDIGGTFTDVLLFQGGRVFVEKTLTTHDDLMTGFFRGVDAVLAKAGITAVDVGGSIVHATTVVTNALIERKGARAGMVFTRGFADILTIRDCRRYDIYDLQLEYPRPLVEAPDIFTVEERMLSDGTVETPPTDEGLAALCAALAERGIDSVGICFLNAYRNGAHERQVADAILRRLPGMFVSLSSEIAPQIREYWRASTTSANAYAIPITQPYLRRLVDRLATQGFPSRPLIMLSSGGVVGAETAGRMPVRMIESGPAAGALGASFAAQALDRDNLLAFDMGGTTAKVCLLKDFQPLITGLFEIDRMYRFKEGSGLPVSVPSVDMIEIGAGGGSIARVDEMGLLKVGPRSAGSRPGPACYGLGGVDPTVTDADVVLGVIDPEGFLGGAMRLDSAAAVATFTGIGRQTNLSPVATARGVYMIVCEAMAGAIRAHAADRGIDHRGIPILAFGGAGPVHACMVAELLKSTTVIFPPLASVYSAFGALVTPARLDLVRSFLGRLRNLDWNQVDALFDDMEAEGRRALVDAGSTDRDVTFTYAADMRYLGQQFELQVDLGERLSSREGGPAIARQRFEAAYLKRYRLIQEKVDVEIVNWRVTASAAVRSAPPLAAPAPGGVESGPRRRKVHLWCDDQIVDVRKRANLAANETLSGPVILEEDQTTIVVPPGWTVSLGPLGCVVAKRAARHSNDVD